MARKEPAITGPSATEQRRWQAEDDLRTLRRAEEIRADKSRVAMAQKMATQEVKALQRVAGKAAPKGKR